MQVFFYTKHFHVIWRKMFAMRIFLNFGKNVHFSNVSQVQHCGTLCTIEKLWLCWQVYCDLWKSIQRHQAQQYSIDFAILFDLCLRFSQFNFSFVFILQWFWSCTNNCVYGSGPVQPFGGLCKHLGDLVYNFNCVHVP